MAADIVPIQLGLTEGNGYTLWAPRWLEDGEEWEAFLGHEDDLYVFPTVAQLAAFIRGVDEHDLSDHPEWETTVTALADELKPDEDHRFDIVGVPDLVAEPADVWALAELADIVAILRSLAEVCDLEVIEEVLDSSDGFALLSHGEAAFAGRTGEKLWDEIGGVVAEKWDKVVDALDHLVTTPEVDPDELATAEEELAAVEAVLTDDSDSDDDDDAERDPDLIFWDGVGIDPVELTVGERTGWTLRCYLDEEPVFLSTGGRVLIFSSPERLENYLTDGTVNNSMTNLEAWSVIGSAIAEGDAAVVAGPENTYQLDGVAEGLLTGPGGLNRKQLSLATELLTDAALARGDDETTDALSSASPLGHLISAIVHPDADRIPPSPPFDDESAAFVVLTERFSGNLDWDAHDEAEQFEQPAADDDEADDDNTAGDEAADDSR
ncbi:primosomal protein [Nakamurella lactea]|uniref:primosomal protein n=1 Tax=Nakamurella lactea TaxID=459515 RepID=UPI0004169571|nr:primosomal protein [Nakamurella lactea]